MTGQRLLNTDKRRSCAVRHMLDFDAADDYLSMSNQWRFGDVLPTFDVRFEISLVPMRASQQQDVDIGVTFIHPRFTIIRCTPLAAAIY